MYNKDKERNLYIKQNHLQDSYIDKKIIYQYKNVIPQRRYVGRTTNGCKIFFEETRGSLVKRNYGKSKEVTSWNLLISDGEKSEKMTKDFIKNNEIIFYDGYSEEIMYNFLENNNKRTNALNIKKKDRKRRSIWADDEEFEIIQEFIRKLRNRG